MPDPQPFGIATLSIVDWFSPEVGVGDWQGVSIAIVNWFSPQIDAVEVTAGG